MMAETDELLDATTALIPPLLNGLEKVDNVEKLRPNSLSIPSSCNNCLSLICEICGDLIVDPLTKSI